APVTDGNPTTMREAIIEVEQAADSAKVAAEADGGVREETRQAVLDAHLTICLLKAKMSLFARSANLNMYPKRGDTHGDTSSSHTIRSEVPQLARRGAQPREDPCRGRSTGGLHPRSVQLRAGVALVGMY